MFISVRSSCALALGVALVLGGAEALEAQRAGGGGGGGGAALTPATYRQQIMQQNQASMAALTAIRNGTVGTPADMVARATILQQLAQSIPGAFPAGSAGGRALPAIWENAAGFAQQVTAFQTATNALVDAARSGNAEQVASAQMGVQQVCGACHMAFRGPAAQ